MEDIVAKLREDMVCLPSVQAKSQIRVFLCGALCVLLLSCSDSTKHSKRCITNPTGCLCSRLNNMMSWEKPQVLATENILHTADESQISFQWSCSPLERETRVDSMLPAQQGTRLDMPGGHTIKPQSTKSCWNSLARNYSIPNCPIHPVFNVHKPQGFWEINGSKCRYLYEKNKIYTHLHWLVYWEEMGSKLCLM